MCVECDLAEPESLASQGGSAPGVVEGILSDWNTLSWFNHCMFLTHKSLYFYFH